MYHNILLVTPCLLTQIREFIHTQHRNTTRPKAKHGIAMLSVDKFPYPRKQTRGNEFIPCSNNICDILKRFLSFKIPAIPLIWSKSPYKHNVTRPYRSGTESGRRSESPLWRHQWRSFVFISHVDDVKREICLYISWLLTNQYSAWDEYNISHEIYSIFVYHNIHIVYPMKYAVYMCTIIYI